ncbi:9062_t:CDS:2 [Acaulospora morrowiae]|uniref:Palmitoyltransferase n=1 Tax=Acaulospora morrowiae TaxID=94023 RepID=A0A9N8W6B3_9GLOM|nr:9062_t:CDS:2 [Acaulospora morrowiae]
MIDTGRLFIVGVSSLVSFLAYSSQIFIFWDFLGGLNVQCLTVLIPFNIAVLMIFYNYYMTCNTDPGRVPKDWCPEEGQDNIEIKRTTHAPRYCRTCLAYKPPRSHHCRTCKRYCYHDFNTNRDISPQHSSLNVVDSCHFAPHHNQLYSSCAQFHKGPWTNNCVGYYNYGHFIRFVFWVDVACIYHFILMIKRTMQIIDDMSMIRFEKEPTTIEMIFIVLNYAAVTPVLFSVGILSMYHFYCMWSNTTTIENWEKDKVLTMVRRGKIKEVVFPYDIGILENVKSILGDNPLLWCWPQQIKGNGLSFPISSNADPTLIWPPKDPNAKATTQLPPKPWELYNLNQNQFYRTNNSQKFSYNNSSSHRRNRTHRHVRRDSEGYIVRDISLEERAMLAEDHRHRINSNDVDNYHDEDVPSDGSTLYSSSEEFSNNEQSEEDDFDDDNYPEHMGIGNDENGEEGIVSNPKYHHRTRHREYDYNRRGDNDEIQDDDSDENIPLGMIIGKKQSHAMNHESGFSETCLKASSLDDDMSNGGVIGSDKVEKVD